MNRNRPRFDAGPVLYAPFRKREVRKGAYSPPAKSGMSVKENSMEVFPSSNRPSSWVMVKNGIPLEASSRWPMLALRIPGWLFAQMRAMAPASMAFTHLS